MSVRQYLPIVYIEGIKFPCLGITISSGIGQPTSINIQLPPTSTMRPDWEIEEATEEQEDDGYICDFSAEGIQPKSTIHVFLQDKKNKEEIFLTQGVISTVAQRVSAQGLVYIITAVGGLGILNEIRTYMLDYLRGVESASGQQVAISELNKLPGLEVVQLPAQIWSTLMEKGFGVGIRDYLESAAKGSNDYLNLIWRLYRFSQRFVCVGGKEVEQNMFWDDNILETVQDKIQSILSVANGMAPVADTITQILQYARMNLINNIAPSFVNVSYPSGIETPSLMIVSEEEQSNNAVDETKEGQAFWEKVTATTDTSKKATIDKNILPDNEDTLMLSDILIMPELPLAPPPRCNVLFPTQYQGYDFSQSFYHKPTRGWCQTSASQAFVNNTSDDSPLLVLPEDIREGINEYGVHWASPEEMYRGIIYSQFNSLRPDYLLDNNDAFIKGVMKHAYERAKHSGNALSITGGALNFNPVLGLPILVLTESENHMIGTLVGISHTITTQGSHTEYSIAEPRDYKESIPESSSDLFWSSKVFDNSVIGSLLYHQILGKNYAYSLIETAEKYPTIDELTLADLPHEILTIIENSNPIWTELSEEIDLSEIKITDVLFSDMSILAHLETVDTETESIVDLLGTGGVLDVAVQEFFGDSTDTETAEEMIDNLNTLSSVLDASIDEYEDITTKKRAPDAIEKAVDALFAEYKDQGSPDQYVYNYGRRIPVGRDQLFTDFYGARGSSDRFSYVGGYSVQKNTLTPRVDDTPGTIGETTMPIFGLPSIDSTEAPDSTTGSATEEADGMENVEAGEQIIDDANDITLVKGEPISADFDIGGCFYLEKQRALIGPANTLLTLVENSIFQDITQISGAGALNIGLSLPSIVEENTGSYGGDTNGE